MTEKSRKLIETIDFSAYLQKFLKTHKHDKNRPLEEQDNVVKALLKETGARNMEEVDEMYRRQEKLYDEVDSLIMMDDDEYIHKYFDTTSRKMLGKKLRVLTKMAAGEDVPVEEYLSILEEYPRDENGDFYRNADGRPVFFP